MFYQHEYNNDSKNICIQKICSKDIYQSWCMIHHHHRFQKTIFSPTIFIHTIKKKNL